MNMSTNQKAQLAANVSSVVGALVTVTTAAIAAGVVIGSLTGHGLTKRGGKRLENAKDFLYKWHPDGEYKGQYIVPDSEREVFEEQRIEP